MYEMSGNTRTLKHIGGLSIAWAIEGTGDFNGDGKSDILVRNSSTGYLFMYEMSGNTRTLKHIGELSTAWGVQAH